MFYSYAHNDEALRDKLATHLKILQRQGFIDEWHDREIGLGQDWANEIEQAMQQAQIILLLVSADFIASDYCWSKELKLALDRHAQQQVQVVPVILRPTDWQDAPFAHLQATPKNAKAVTLWENQDEAFTNIAQSLRQLVQKMRHA